MNAKTLIALALDGADPQTVIDEGMLGRAGAKMLLTLLLTVFSGAGERPSGGAREAQAFLNQGGKRYEINVREV